MRRRDREGGLIEREGDREEGKEREREKERKREREKEGGTMQRLYMLVQPRGRLTVRLHPGCSERAYNEGEVLCRQGEVNGTMYAVMAGSVQLVK